MLKKILDQATQYIKQKNFNLRIIVTVTAGLLVITTLVAGFVSNRFFQKKQRVDFVNKEEGAVITPEGPLNIKTSTSDATSIELPHKEKLSDAVPTQEAKELPGSDVGIAKIEIDDPLSTEPKYEGKLIFDLEETKLKTKNNFNYISTIKDAPDSVPLKRPCPMGKVIKIGRTEDNIVTAACISP